MQTYRLPPALVPVAATLRSFGSPWAIAGGWALDLALGHESRTHADVDIAVFRDDQGALRAHFAGWTLTYMDAGERHSWAPGRWLELPVHEVYAASPDPAGPTLELLLNERAGTDWVFRRDPAIRLPIARALRTTASGLPVLAPEIVLLYKAKAPRAHDDADFVMTHAVLSTAGRAWLADAIAHCHPGHRWLRALTSASS
ncbi:MAG: hypothetical protein WKG32_18205 [Gemmatimonadaceae bacterium]